MKTITIIWLVLAVLLVALNYAANYWLGYAEIPAAIAASNPYFALQAEFVLFLLFIIPALGSELARKGRFWSYVGLLAFWPLVVGTFQVVKHMAKPAGALVAKGLRDRLTREVSLDDLRHFAKEVNDAGFLKEEDLVNPADTSGLLPQQDDLLVDFRDRYPFMNWLSDGKKQRGPCLLNYGQESNIFFEWGTEGRGHWGCSISLGGAKNETVPFLNGHVNRLSDDIYLYYHP